MSEKIIFSESSWPLRGEGEGRSEKEKLDKEVR